MGTTIVYWGYIWGTKDLGFTVGRYTTSCFKPSAGSPKLNPSTKTLNPKPILSPSRKLARRKPGFPCSVPKQLAGTARFQASSRDSKSADVIRERENQTYKTATAVIHKARTHRLVTVIYNHVKLQNLTKDATCLTLAALSPIANIQSFP